MQRNESLYEGKLRKRSNHRWEHRRADEQDSKREPKKTENIIFVMYIYENKMRFYILNRSDSTAHIGVYAYYSTRDYFGFSFYFFCENTRKTKKSKFLWTQGKIKNVICLWLCVRVFWGEENKNIQKMSSLYIQFLKRENNKYTYTYMILFLFLFWLK